MLRKIYWELTEIKRILQTIASSLEHKELSFKSDVSQRNTNDLIKKHVHVRNIERSSS